MAAHLSSVSSLERSVLSQAFVETDCMAWCSPPGTPSTRVFKGQAKFLGEPGQDQLTFCYDVDAQAFIFTVQEVNSLTMSK